MLNQRRILEQSNDFCPYNLIQKILAYEATVVAHGTAQFSPAVRANALVVVQLARARDCGGPRESVPAFLTTNQALHDARCDRPTLRPYLVLLKKFLRLGKTLLGHERRHWNFDPLVPQALMTGAVTLGYPAPQTQWSRDAAARSHTSFFKVGYASVRRVAQDSPYHRAFPARAFLASRDTLPVEPTRDLADAESPDGVHVVNALYYARLSIDHQVRRGSILSLADITVPIRSAAHHTDLAGFSAVSLTAAIPLHDLCPLVFRNHALELNDQLILGGCALRCVDEERFDSVPGEFLAQQNLIGVLATQSVRRVDENHLDLPLGREVSYPLETWSLECRATIAFVFEHPLPGYFQLVGLRELDQRRRLARDRVFLALLLRRYSCVYCRHLHECFPLLVARQRGALVRVPKCHTPVRAYTRAGDQTHSRDLLEVSDAVRAAQPCLLGAPRKASSARVTIVPIVRPLLFA